ncbi:tryptophan synthase subunit beta [Helicobacter saguini]|uniref:Tryptophan synthase beta chain n=1 Tax=Helicobacter saguini TaxID=1548018 RepID=A0A347VL73_9HELI|nr:tryptophan synthase subunit beta [Helicobacter saguini]MWV67877.1 tryptophan synthase subunit beta [Helicobacter saguini]MWV70654.1 tryptophan synthase subunit beta [Helicobacter saguini]MWV72559.1 tryptophan synthase subunit beta [Helicobacter saguini]TLD94705.1 tryptophan synthase subunit beta [Helicobacter saguini]
MKKMFLESKNGYFGEEDSKFGGCFIPETLYSAIKDLQKAYKEIFKSKEFKKELKGYYKSFVGRPTPLIYAKNVSEMLGNEIYLKFEGLANTGAHKINNALAQALLAKKMGKSHIIAETGAGQHGLATAAVCAFLKLPCKIFMGEIDIARQRPNVFIMEQFGAEVIAVKSGSKTLKDAVNEALREWSKTPDTSFYVLGSALGPYPYPDIVRDAQSIIGKEIKKQIRKAIGVLPHYVIACVGGGSNAMGAFSAFLEDKEVRLIGVEAGGEDFIEGKNAMRLSPQSKARVGIAHGYKSFFLQDSNGQIAPTHSISAGLDYAGVSPQLAHLHDIGRVEFIAASDKEALSAMQFFARHEGILAALESSHALSGVINLTKKMSNKIIVVNVSGRGDKDIFITAKRLCKDAWREFLQSEIDSMQSRAKYPFEIAALDSNDSSVDSSFKIHPEEFKSDLEDIAHEGIKFIDSAVSNVVPESSPKVESKEQITDDLSLEDLEGEELIEEVNNEIEEIFEQIDSIQETIDNNEKEQNLKNVIQDTISDIESKQPDDVSNENIDSLEPQGETSTNLESSELDSIDSIDEADLEKTFENIETKQDSIESNKPTETIETTEIIESNKPADVIEAADSVIVSGSEAIQNENIESSENLESVMLSESETSTNENIESSDNLESFEPTPEPLIESKPKTDSNHYDLLHFLDSKNAKSEEKKHLNKSHFSLLEFLDPKDSNIENIESKSEPIAENENIESNETTEQTTENENIESNIESAPKEQEKEQENPKEDSIESNIESAKQDSNTQNIESKSELAIKTDEKINLAKELQSELAGQNDLDFSFLDKDSNASADNIETQETKPQSETPTSEESIDTTTKSETLEINATDSNLDSTLDTLDSDIESKSEIDSSDSNLDSTLSELDSDNSDFSQDLNIESTKANAESSLSKTDADIIADMFQDALLKDSLDTMDADEYEIGDYCDLEDKLHLDTLEQDLDFTNLDSPLESLESTQDSTIESSLESPQDSTIESSENIESNSDFSQDSTDLSQDSNIESAQDSNDLAQDSNIDFNIESSLESNTDSTDLNLDLNIESPQDSTIESNLDSTDLNLDSTIESTLDSTNLKIESALDSNLDSTDLTLESTQDSNIDSNIESTLDSNDLAKDSILDSSLDSADLALESSQDSIESTLDSNIESSLDLGDLSQDSILDSSIESTQDSILDSTLDSSDLSLESTQDSNIDSADLNLESSIESTLESSDLAQDSSLDSNIESSLETSTDSADLNIDLNIESNDLATDSSLDLSLDSTIESSENIESNIDFSQDLNQDLNQDSSLDITLDSSDLDSTLDENISLDFNADLNADSSLDFSLDSSENSSENSPLDLDFGDLESSENTTDSKEQTNQTPEFNFDTQEMQEQSQSKDEKLSDAITNAQPKSRIFETHKDLSKIWGKSLNS